jgi:hypothetical protein
MSAALRVTLRERSDRGGRNRVPAPSRSLSLRSAQGKL